MTKYYAKIEADQADDANAPVSGFPDFDFESYPPVGGWPKLQGRLIASAMPLLLWVLREFFPVARFTGFYWITRKQDVVDALERPDDFNVPYGREMRELSRVGRGRGATEADFVLGLDGPPQARQNEIIRKVVLPGDVDRTSQWSAAFAESLVEGGEGRLDVIGDFAVRIPTEICRRYFGLSFPDPGAFADWCMALSGLLFADPGGDRKKRDLAKAAAVRLCHVIDLAIGRAQRRLENIRHRKFADLTLVDRLVRLRRDEPDLGLENPEIRAILLGLAVGFIPTNGLAAANMIEGLLKRPGAMRAARAAAERRDHEAMRRVVKEAGRLYPALAPGQWRYAARDLVVGEGRPYARTIPAGSTVMVSTMSALRDKRAYRAPERFDPEAGNDAELMFGHATHKCLGQHLALGIITAMFLVLFRQPDLRPVRGRLGRMQRAGYFPRRLDMRYESAASIQTMVLVCVPIDPAVDAAEIEARVRRLGNPATDAVARSLKDTGIVHFASASVVSAAVRKKNDAGKDPGPFNLIIELNVDGPRDPAVELIARHGDDWLRPLLRAARPRDTRPPVEILRRHYVNLTFSPWGPTGLNFFGTGGLSVERIEKQKRLRTAVDTELGKYLKHDDPDCGLGNRALVVLAAVRRGLRTGPWDRDLDAFVVQPERKTFAPSGWRKPEGFWAPAEKIVRSWFGLKLVLLFLISTLATAVPIHFALDRGLPAPPDGGLYLTVSHWAVVTVAAVIATLAIWSALAWLAFAIFQEVEKREAVEDAAPDADSLRDIVARENAPDYRQNHIIAVTPFKRGLVRRLSFAFAMWGIRQSLHWFRPGFVVTMGTIHFAKWFRMPGSRKMIFQSNYDGSWESYLEDFITRAHEGQTAAWSNAEGFPRSRNLIGKGAEDGDRFKRWVRRHQIPTAFWYSRFPDLTTREMRLNALVHQGIARARTDTAARSWLDLLGSAQRQPWELESLEIQSLLFRGLKGARFTACMPLQLPPHQRKRGEWLDAVSRELSFGKFPQDCGAMYLALSAAGLRKFTPEDSDPNGPLDLAAAFPSPFNVGMADRHAILGDAPPGGPGDRTQWRDGGPSAETVADAVLMIYRPTTERLTAEIRRQTEALEKLGGRVVHGPILTVQLDEKGEVHPDGSVGDDRRRSRASYEHFGFRDGVAAPIIRGTEQFSPRGGERETVEPGEFILGYRNNQGYFAPSVIVPSLSDQAEHLPVAADAMAFGFADFKGADEQFANRDFGRNGAFLVIRQLNQDVEGFNRFAAEKADELNREYGSARLHEVTGSRVTGDWVKAKMMGRWRDGRPLIGNPTEDSPGGDRSPDNNFSYGRDDPRGHACPLGAHIRRANPRDSLEPDDPQEQVITRRHALLRRGRVYFYDRRRKAYAMRRPPARNAEHGLLFVALCADLERQFELVQQTWINNPSFHGLTREPDPISSPATSGGDRCFTIPTAAGPLTLKNMQSFIELRGGGYFFLPSRSAIAYLANFTIRDPTELSPFLTLGSLSEAVT
ncbi:cytochrome P450 [Brevundimonas sp.]|uniref:cytochrome P450 n=1 Tax=Brevundimonas sp. TaxID=1871086 RepID=UPI002D4464E4|nr:cytochrome P450 [Brevundimonas sp.]HYC96424.1 cytochrome P450 [Brevundimonas sp.]